MRKREEQYEENEQINGEETEAQEEKPSPRSKQSLKFARYLLLLIMVMVGLIFLFAYRDQINGDNFRRLFAKINIGTSSTAGADGELRFDAANGGKTVVYKDGFAHATVEKLIVTDKNGTEFQNTALGYRNPMLYANRKYVLAYDVGGTGIIVTDSFTVRFEMQTEDPILAVRMNEDGALVVVTEGDGYLAKVYVYDSSFKEVYRYRSLSRYILDAALTDDCKAMAISALNIEGGDIVSEILYFKLSKEEMQWSVAFDEAPCVSLSVKKNGSICGLFDWGMVSLSSKGKEQGRYLLDEQVLQCFSMTDDEMNVFAVSAAENGDASIVICDEKGKVKDTVALEHYAVQLDYGSGRIAVLGNQVCGVYNRNGKKLWSDTPERAVDISLMGRNTVVVVSETKCVYNSIK